MYIPDAFAEPRPEELHRLIAAHPLGMLVTRRAEGLDADHVPFEFDPRVGAHGVLRAHVARANPVWRAVRDGDAVLVAFRAGDAYVSPNWSPSKHEFHRQVPTWNYRVVHAHGTIAVRDDERFVRGVIARLTRTHEASQPVPWRMGDAPRDHIDALVRNIVGLEIAVTRLEGKLKLNQNREPRDRRGVADALARQGDAALARAVRDTLDADTAPR